MDAEIIVRCPQDGPQMAFMATPADIAIYGGAAGGGKTWALLMEPTRHLDVDGFGAVFFRRTTVQIRNEGGLWDESMTLYPDKGGSPREHLLEWRFPTGASVSFAHLEHEKNKLDYQGAQIPLICWDELTHFSASQFWYMLSRNRSMCGVRPYMRATCNPDADSWVSGFIEWWIDQKTGYPIPERAGKLRWFVRVNDVLLWADTAAELEGHLDPINGDPIPPKSVTFIPAKLSDNKALMKADPGYLANLLALPKVERERLLGGNWKIRAAAGLLFQRTWCRIIDEIPADLEIIRGWDFAATPKTTDNEPDSTASCKIGRTREGRYIVLDSTNVMEGPSGVERHLINVATHDTAAVLQSLPQDPGAAGKSYVASQIKALVGYNARSSPESGDKVTRFNPFSAQAEAGNVDVVRGVWNDRWFEALENFPPPTTGGHDDDADSTARAFNTFLAPVAGAAYLELAMRNIAAHEVEAQRQRFERSDGIVYAKHSPEWRAEQALLPEDERDRT